MSQAKEGFRYKIEDASSGNEYAFSIFAACLACDRPVGGTIRFPMNVVHKPSDEVAERECVAMLKRRHKCPAARSSVLYKAGVLH